MKNVRRVVKYLMGDMRDHEIKTPRPQMNPFTKFSFRNLSAYSTPTLVIPEDVIEQINRRLDELPSIHKLLYDIFINTGLRLREVFFLEIDCVEESRYEGICQLKFKPYKVLAARRRHGAGDYHRAMIEQALADKIICYINDTAPLREANESFYVFLSQKSGSGKALMDHNPFVKSVRNIIENMILEMKMGNFGILPVSSLEKLLR